MKPAVVYTVMPELGGQGGPLVPHYLANQLTLFQPLADHPPAGGFARPSGVAGNKSALN